MFKKEEIDGVVIKDLIKHRDERGWLTEIFREDEIAEDCMPVMAYVSMTEIGVARGPHEHGDQVDNFALLGPSNFKVYLWDNRQGSPTYMSRLVIYAGEDGPKSVSIPAGGVHAYKNVGDKPGMVVNFPNSI